MRESTIENYLVKQCAKYGAWAEKHVSPGYKGPPDRDVLWPHGFTDWVEVKRPGGRIKDHQERDHARRRKLGHRVWVPDTKADVDEYIEFCLKRHALAERMENGL